MALHAYKRAKTINPTPSQRYTAAPRKSFFIFSLVLAGAFITFGAFISLEASILATILVCMVAFFSFEERRRRLWEKALTFKLRTTDKKYERLTRDVTRHHQEIENLKIKQAHILNIQDHLINAPKENHTAKTRNKPSTPLPCANDEAYFEQNALSDAVVTELIHHAVRQSRIEVFIQPVMRLPQRKARYYEMFARIRAQAGSYLPAGQYMHLAQKENLEHEIDTLLLIECLKVIQKTATLDRPIPFILNISSKTLKNKSFMSKLLTFLSKNRTLASRLIFEIKQHDFNKLSPALIKILKGLGQLGCALSLDHVERFEFDVRHMQNLKVRLIKIRYNALRTHNQTAQKTLDFIKIKRTLEGNGIGVAIERIEKEEDLRTLLDLNIGYGQGYLFAKPAPQSVYKNRKTA